MFDVFKHFSVFKHILICVQRLIQIWSRYSTETDYKIRRGPLFEVRLGHLPFDTDPRLMRNQLITEIVQTTSCKEYIPNYGKMCFEIFGLYIIMRNIESLQVNIRVESLKPMIIQRIVQGKHWVNRRYANIGVTWCN